MNKKINKSSGQVSRLLLVLAIVIFVAVIIVFIIMKAAQKPATPAIPKPSTPVQVYEATIGNIKFIFQDAVNMGNILKGSATKNYQYQKDVVTKERFIAVTIGAQNQGKENTPDRFWDLGNIIDSEGRNYVPLDSYTVGAWLPDPNLCGVLLKPAFIYTPCEKIYEVAKVSTGLKIEVKTGSDSNNPKKALIDLIVTPQ